MKTTRTCRRCRQPQLIENLVEKFEGKTRRYVCAEPCKTNNKVAVVESQVEESNEDLDILDSLLNDEILDIEVKLNAKTSKVKVIEVPAPTVEYNGEDTELDTIRPQFLTTMILSEQINSDLVKAAKTWAITNNGVVNIFFKKRYLRDECTLDVACAQLRELLDGCDYEFVTTSDLVLNNQLTVLASANVGHTAVSPLSGVKSRAVTDYLVIPHARQEIEVTVNTSWEKKSLLMSTGCINNLSKGHTQALGKVKFHSIIGGVVYRPVKEDGYGLLPVNFDGHGFYEYNTYYTEDGSKDGFADSIVLGDLHASMACPEYIEKMKQDIAVMQPSQILAGDVSDNQSVCYHDQDTFGYHQHRMSFVEELKITKDIIRDLQSAAPNSKFVAIGSNHDNFLGKYIKTPSNLKALGKDDAVIIYKAMAYMMENSSMTNKGIKYGNPTKFLYDDLVQEGILSFKPVERHNVTLKFHGHEFGVSQNLGNRSNMKVIIGHGHSPYSRKGVTAVGTCQRENPEYQNGVSASAQGLCVLHSNGKRSLLINL